MLSTLATGGAPTIEVWAFALDESLAAFETLDGLEQARLRRLRSESKRLEFLVGRSMLRRILGEHLDVRPADVRLEYGRHGKPKLRGEELMFNLSHSGNCAIVAIGADGRVGVDIEHRRPRRPFRELSRRFFAEAEDRWLAALPGADRADGFYRVWTLKEAYLKAIGTGLTFSSRGFGLDMAQTPPRLRATDYPGDEPHRWRFETPEMAGTYVAALCWEGEARGFRCREISELAPARG